MIDNNFGKRLKELRIENNLNLIELANYIGVGKSTISNWELGQNEPTLSSLIKLANFFKVSIDFLAGREI